MKISYHILLDDPSTATTRTFYREAGEWPFPTLPAPGDAVTIDIQSSGRWVRMSGEGDTALNRWTLPRPMQTRAVGRVVYDPREGMAHILFPVTALEDPEQQIRVLEESGFREISG